MPFKSVSFFPFIVALSHLVQTLFQLSVQSTYMWIIICASWLASSCLVESPVAAFDFGMVLTPLFSLRFSYSTSLITSYSPDILHGSTLTTKWNANFKLDLWFSLSVLFFHIMILPNHYSFLAYKTTRLCLKTYTTCPLLFFLPFS